MTKYLVTGTAGFIGNFVSERLCDAGHDVIGFKPDTNIEYGMQQFVDWFKDFYKE